MKKTLATLLMMVPLTAFAHPGHAGDDLISATEHLITGWGFVALVLLVSYHLANWLLSSERVQYRIRRLFKKRR